MERNVQPLKGNFFQLGTAQRLDLRLTIPSEGGAFPILAQGEGTNLLSGLVLRTKDAAVPPLSRTAAKLTASLDNTQELHLRAARPLAARAADRTLPAALGGDMKNYVWTINDAAYPNRSSLDVRIGERVEIDLTNSTSMAHPMHLHGHDFEVLSVDGEPIPGALRDTVVVPPGSKISVGFDADNAGIWAFHCHLIYHLVTGMFTVLRYDGADVQFWQPEKQASELKNQPEPFTTPRP
jgi:FtsP/CotA-like multicopper oxidase with cupredoxin domain